MGVNLAALRSLPGSSGSSRSSGRPPRSSGRPWYQSTPSRMDLIVITYKDRDISAKIHKTAQIRFNHTTKPTLTGRS